MTEPDYKEMWEKLKAILHSDLDLSIKGLRHTLSPENLDLWYLTRDAECARRCDIVLEMMRDIEIGTEDYKK